MASNRPSRYRALVGCGLLGAGVLLAAGCGRFGGELRLSSDPYDHHRAIQPWDGRVERPAAAPRRPGWQPSGRRTDGSDEGRESTEP